MAKLRKQYHHRNVDGDRCLWDVHRLIRMSRSLVPQRVALSEIGELDENWWYQSADQIPTPRDMTHHMQLVQAADLKYPVILCAEARVMDGMHRICKALMQGQEYVNAVKFLETPAPDYINASPEDLTYPEEDV